MLAAMKDLLCAIDAALAGHWHEAHAIAQRLDADPLACWLHAVLHKIEGDAANSRYWYAKSGLCRFEAFADPRAELEAIRARLAAG